MDGTELGSEDFNQKHAFIIKLAMVAYGYGVSLPRLEAVLNRLATAFDFKINTMSNGKIAQFIFWHESGEQEYSYFERLPAVNPNLSKLVLLENLAVGIEKGKIKPEAGLVQLAEIEKKPVNYGTLINFLAFGLIGAGVAIIFSSPWIDVILGGLLGVLAYGIVLVASKKMWSARTIEFLIAFVGAFIAVGLASLFPGSSPGVLVLCAIAVFIPGFTLTSGLAELFLHYTVSGINRMVDGVIITGVLIAGVVIGAALSNLFWAIPTPVGPVTIMPLVFWGFMVLFFLAIGLFFQADRMDLIWIILVGLLTFAAMNLGGQLGFWQGPFLGALVIGVCGNVFSRLRKLPSTIIMLPTIMALVPGTLALIGVFPITGIDLEAVLITAWQVFATFVAIFLGIIVANIIVKPKLTF